MRELFYRTNKTRKQSPNSTVCSRVNVSFREAPSVTLRVPPPSRREALMRRTSVGTHTVIGRKQKEPFGSFVWWRRWGRQLFLGFAKTRFGAHGRFCCAHCQPLQHYALKTLPRSVFACRTDIGTGFRFPFQCSTKNKKGLMALLFLVEAVG